ncbi:phosphatidylglycerol lysyltransferase domain-containing protein [Corynebacterium callunae]|uniref:bifunctional lysylphosphatidylglycerol flippase/synthetase MprF n=1 Tax=Corynebacterium callunae TaxID=1721 RepID=UPI003981B9AD
MDIQEKQTSKSFKNAQHWVLVQLRQAPLSFIALALMWLLWGLLGSNSEQLLNQLGMSTQWQWGEPLLPTAGLTTATLRGAVMSSLWLVLLAIPAEKTLGSRKFALFSSVLYLLSIPLSLLLVEVFEGAQVEIGAVSLFSTTLLTPDFWIFGIAAVASGYRSLLWRRRIRLVLFSISLTLLFYTGTVADSAIFSAVVVGTLWGEILRVRRAGLNFWNSFRPGPWTVRETRIIVAIVMSVSTLGPVISALNPLTKGPFSASTRLIWAPVVTEERMHHLCRVDSTSTACQESISQLQQHGFTPMLANLIPVILTLILAVGLSRGRRAAWWMSVAAQIATLAVLLFQMNRLTADITDIVGLFSILKALIPWLIVLGLLLVFRRSFMISIESSNIIRTLGKIGLAFIATSILWLAGALLIPHAFHPQATFLLALQELPLRYLPPTVATVLNHYLFPHSAVAWALFEWTGTLFWLATAFIIYRLLVGVPNTQAAQDRARASEILRQGSGDHLSWMTLWAGNSYWWAPDNKGYVAYRLRNGVAISLGEPIVSAAASAGTSTGTSAAGAGGVGSARMEIAQQFEDFMMTQGWQVAWYSVREDFTDELKLRGHRRLRLAEEAVLSTELAEFKGKKFQNVRTARNRALKEGITTQWTTWAESSTEMHNEILDLSEEWVSEKALPEMGFTLGTVNELRDPYTQLLLAVDEQGHLHGITSWLPVYENGQVIGYTLDVMRRDPQGFRSVIEFLMSEAVIHAKERGLKWVSLSGAPLSTPPELQDAGALGKTLDLMGRTMEPFYGFRSLAASKNKFQPEHHGWYLSYRDELALPAIGVAIAGCYVDGFPWSLLSSLKLLGHGDN